MPKKEDRSDWVAVAPEFQSKDNNAVSHEIKKAATAYQFFQKDVSATVQRELREASGGGTFDIAQHGRAVRDKWNALGDGERERYLELQRQDQTRFAQESHAADVAALERRERLRRERAALPLYDEGGGGGGEEAGGRTTRRKLEKRQRQRARQAERAEQKKKNKQQRRKSDDDDDDDEDFEEEESSSGGSWDSDDLSDSSEEKKKKKAPPVPKRQPTQKQVERREKIKQEKLEKEKYIENRQEDLRKERAAQAKRRLEFLLKQSDIFSHFGGVKEDTAKYGMRAAAATATAAAPPSETKVTAAAAAGSSRRGSTLQVEQDEAAALEEADEHEATFLTEQPSTLSFGKMRDYQLEGLNWMVSLQENGVNGILADEMGLGKTLQSISILVYMMEFRNANGPHLIVVPKSTLSNWMNELERWAPTLNAVKFHGDKATRDDIISTILEPGQRDEDRDWHVVVTTYEVCNIEKNTLNKFAWSYLIIDEAHRLKNEASAFSITVRTFETRYRLLLTGTPLQNNLHELWALLSFLIPDVFASAEQFDEWFNLDIDDDSEKNKLISQLHKILRPFMLRRLKVDVEKSLPPKHETILYTGMSSMQKKLYKDILIRDIDAIQGTSGSRTAILNIVMQLRKCAGHPYLFPGVEDRTLPPLGEHLVENCGKMVVLDKLLKRLHERGHRVLLFTQMTRILDIMEDYLVMRRFNYCRIDGNTSYEDREAYIEAYNKPDSEKFLFLLSTRAGGLGINLQTADIVILYDSDWNPQADLQAQDRAHRIGQKRPVQVFRLVTEHTIEEKIVERAQQKLKLDAMVVQSGRLKDKDSKLSRDELLSAVKFGADKIFKSKDSSITDDDIDLILDAGRKKTQELNEKLKAAEKGDLLDFKFDGSSVQTFDGVDYSKSALDRAKADAEMLGIFDIGKRERKEANYNENSIYRQQMTALQTVKKKKKKSFKLPKHLRLPRMEEWQMFDRDRLFAIQEEEETTFKNLPEEDQKRATMVGSKEESAPEAAESGSTDAVEEAKSAEPEAPFELPPLLSEELRAEKDKLLSEGFIEWKRNDYTNFVKASAKHGRNAVEKIALEVGKPEPVVREFSAAFWGDLGRTRIAEHEYDRVTKIIERGEKKIEEMNNLERATRILVDHFDNPWQELEFTHVNCKDKMYTAEEDRHLLCWARKYGYGQWMAIKNAVRRNPNFRFDYFLRSLAVDAIGRRCEQLMRAAEKEVEQLERTAREAAGLPVEPENEGDPLPPIEIPPFRVLQRQRIVSRKTKAETERKQLESKVDEIEAQIRAAKERLKALSEGATAVRVSPVQGDNATEKESAVSRKRSGSTVEEEAPAADSHKSDDENGAAGPDGTYVEFPEYDGSEPPLDWKKPFTQYCIRTKKSVKAKMDPADRKNKAKVQQLLKQGWLDLSESEKDVFRAWTEWDKKRYARDQEIFRSRRDVHDDTAASAEDDDMKAIHVPKKRKHASSMAVPKKKKKA